MKKTPKIHYAGSGDTHIAYQTWGQGPALVGVPLFVRNIEALRDDPTGSYPRSI